MLEVLRKIAGGSRPATAAQLREALASIDEAALVAAVDEAAATRREMLLKADEKQIEKAEAALAHARRELDRGRAAVEALAAKIAEADNAEAAAALKAERDEIDQLADGVARDLARIYPRASREIIAIFERLEEAECRIEAFNRKVLSGGTPACPLIKHAEERVFPTPGDNLEGILSVLRLTELRPVRGSPGWGQPRVHFETVGYAP